MSTNNLLNMIQSNSSADDVYYAAESLREIGDSRAIHPLLNRLKKGIYTGQKPVV